MEQIRLVIIREYWTRIRRRSFILATLLTPLIFGIFIAVVQLIFGYESDDTKRIAVLDPSQLIEGGIADGNSVYFEKVSGELAVLRQSIGDMGYDGLLLLPAVQNPLQQSYSARLYTDEKLSLDAEGLITNRLRKLVRDYKVEALELEEAALEALDTRIEVVPYSLLEDGEEGTTLAGRIGAAMGMIMGIVMYITVFIYGMMVMRSVMEEKTNRIVEVMISSVRPFPLMLGKIIGVGAVGLTQVIAWAILIPLIFMGVSLFFGIQPNSGPLPEGATIEQEEAQAIVSEVLAALGEQQWGIIVPLFFLYFLGGYFMYASLFAAVGSAMGDDLGEGQALTIPITIPVILAFYIMFATIQSPNSSLAIFSSLFPLFSPIVMPARLPFDPPWWEVVSSVVLLMAAAVGLVWVSGRIYRIGILTYGKKVGLRQLASWMFSNN